MTANRKAMEDRVGKLSEGQLALLNSVLETFEQPVTAKRRESSDVVSPDFLEAFGDMLKLHHSLSNDYLDKHRFEAVMERVYRALGRRAERPARNFPGQDLTVDGVPWSLKTEGAARIRRDVLHISKFMELGQGRWESAADLPGLRDRFLKHMNAYQRILQLRYFKRASNPSMPSDHYYELVEIPKALLQECERGEFKWMEKSKQTPKPGYCTVTDEKGQTKFKLYFDGGTERKLQIKSLRKDLCVVHATWEF